MPRLIRRLATALLACATAMPLLCQAPSRKADIVIYGATSAGIAAAVQARRMGKSVILLEPSSHVGGLTTGGLGATDIGNKRVIGGVSREFYRRVKAKYDDQRNWVSETWDQYLGRLNFFQQSNNKKSEDAVWRFEPKIASAVYRDMLADVGVTVTTRTRLDLRPGKGVIKQGARIAAIVMEDGARYEGRMFIDATYEGDLMAKSGVSYHVGRESNSVYDETWNGSQAVHEHSHQFPAGVDIDPYVIPGKPASGLLPGIDATGPGVEGAGDKRIQAYCFRMCLTNIASNRLPISKPEGYDEREHELLLRVVENGRRRLGAGGPIPNNKTDTNNSGAVSTDYIGANWDYPEGDHATRERIIRRHEIYQRGYLWTLQNHPRVPEATRKYYRQWGLPKDEFTENGGWATQLYVREARRMVGDVVMTEHHVVGRTLAGDSVGMGAYTMDSHNVQRYVTPQGYVRNEGNVEVGGFPPYPISYKAIIPQRAEAENLFVPVCLSASHIAYGSIRMEPVFMVLGQSSATAAVIAINAGVPVQDLNYARLRARLLADGQVLEAPHDVMRGDLDPALMEGVVIDNPFAKVSPAWKGSRQGSPMLGPGYFIDQEPRDGRSSAKFHVKARVPGRLRVKVLYPHSAGRATNVPVEISGGGKMYRAVIDQRQPAGWLGPYELPTDFTVTITNKDANGVVAVDGVQVASVAQE